MLVALALVSYWSLARKAERAAAAGGGAPPSRQRSGLAPLCAIVRAIG